MAINKYVLSVEREASKKLVWNFCKRTTEKENKNKMY